MSSPVPVVFGRLQLRDANVELMVSILTFVGSEGGSKIRYLCKH